MFGVSASNGLGARAFGLPTGLLRAARAGVGWWTGELRGLLPASLTALILGPSGDVVLRLAQDGLHLGTPVPHGTWLTEDGAFPPASQARAVLAKATACTIVVPAQSVLRRAINLPLAAAGDLESAVPFLVERYTPFALEEVRYDFRLLARDRARKLATLELAVVPRSALERPLAIAAAHRLPVAAMRVDGDEAVPPFDLLSRSERGRGGAWAPRRHLWKPVLAAAAAVLILGLPTVAATVHARAVSTAAEAEAASAAGRRGAALQQEVQAHVRAAAFMPARLRGPQPLEILNELSRSLPDDTWLFSLEAEPGEVRLAGYSRDVPALLKQLAALPFVEAPELRGPVVHGANNRDRFEAGFRVRTPAP